MDDKLTRVNQILTKYNQEHLLCFYQELPYEQQQDLLNQILKINFEEILSLYKNSFTNDNSDLTSVTPLPHIEKSRLSQEELNYYTKIGEEIIKSNSLAVVTMAGGQGTRLGYKGPKGTYPLDLKPQKKSLFQIMCEDIKRANEKYNIIIPWYIMTSEENDIQTKNFFESNDYWGYPKEKIKFFTQGKLPLISVEGKLMLQEPYLIREASNGNGNVFDALSKHNILQDFKENNIQWISFAGIDNILLKNVDPLFLGLTVKHNNQVASKSIFKQTPLEKTAVYCRKYGKPAILDYVDIEQTMSYKKDSNNMYLYRDANMLSHLFSFDALQKLSNIKLRYHRAYKKYPFINDEGMKQVPNSPNAFKFENFIFDGFGYFDDLLLLRVDANEEFAPIKDFTGIYNPDTAKEKYEKFWNLK